MSLLVLRALPPRGGAVLPERPDLALGPGERRWRPAQWRWQILAPGPPPGAAAGGGRWDARGGADREHLALDERQRLDAALAFWVADPGPGIAAMGLEGLAEVPVRMLSAGQRKRAALARVVASGAPLWLLDEPANGLDGDGLARLEAAMAVHLGGGGAILAASHQPLGLADAHEVRLG